MESVLNNTKPINVIPSYASVEEHALYTIASVEEAYTDLCKSIGIAELAAVMEAEGKTNLKEKLTAVKNKIVNFFKEQWEKFKGLCATARQKIKTFVNEKYKALAGKAKPDELKKAIEASKEERWTAEYKNLWVWSDLGSVDGQTLLTIITKATTAETDKILSKLNAAKDDKEKIQDIDVNALFGNVIKDKVDIKAEDFGNAGKIQTAIKDKCIKQVGGEGNGAKAYFAKNIAQYCANIKDTPALFDKNIKSGYNGTKSALDKLIREVKKADSDKAFTKMIAAATSMLRINSAVVGACEQATLRVFVSEFRIVAKATLINAALNNKKEEVKSESAAPEVTDEAPVTVETPAPEAPVAESSTFQTELASLFNF